ncbi:MAG: protein kinase, partial [Gemmatimonadetes bacterium]|nr:protein kinase [Gemmatimonadota bacterium]NIR80324.1 protein kinase [Gemmatimonadota bacterium]NIT89087.1 protein kinase [Gemmatimonadota bacterium]NIU32884.1 protein kinase [Gemmatimonadota bacterium]NIU37290.1 protein kinase [Gemmatimonadota bacterium]
MFASLRLSALGIPRVSRGDEELTAFARQPLRTALLFYLGVEERSTRSAVSTLLWPEREESRARHALSQMIYELRQDLGDEVIRSVGEELRIGPGVAVDVREFEEAVEAGDFRRASELYAGGFLEGTHLCDSRAFEGWVDSTRARLSRLHRVAQRQRITELVGDADLAGALRAARKWATLDPLDDEAQHALIELLGRCGERAAALRRYEAFRERLAEELEVEPLEETRELAARLREGATEDSSRPGREGPVLAARTKEGGPDTVHEPRHRLDQRVAAGLGPDLKLVRTLGEGTVSRVFLARESALKRLVAVKVLKPEVSRDETGVRRFQREAEAAARIQHPNVVTVHWIGELPSGEPFLVMPYLRGGSLAERIQATGPLAPAEGRRVLL